MAKKKKKLTAVKCENIATINKTPRYLVLAKSGGWDLELLYLSGLIIIK